jgi:hypothetical protein
MRDVVRVVVGPIKQLSGLVEVKLSQIVGLRNVTCAPVLNPSLAGLTVYVAPITDQSHPRRLRRVRVVRARVGQLVDGIADVRLPPSAVEPAR